MLWHTPIAVVTYVIQNNKATIINTANIRYYLRLAIFAITIRDLVVTSVTLKRN